MPHHDVLVLGGGTGNNVAAAAADAGMDAALVEPGPLGGTCLNRGCNPSKMLIKAADAVEGVRGADRFGVDATLHGVDTGSVVRAMDDTLSGIAAGMEDRYRAKEHLTLYDAYGRFVDDRTVALESRDGEGTADAGLELTADRIVVATGSRPLVPPIDGLGAVDYLTSQEALYLEDPPDSLVVLGGGYIAVELGYYFGAMGTDVTLIEMEPSLIPREDADVAEAFTAIAADRHDVYTGYRATGVEPAGDGVRVHAEPEDGDAVAVEADDVLVALGRRPNTDDLGLDAAGVAVDDRGFVETDEQLRTTADGVWAQGDVAGNALFKHGGDYETQHTVGNVVHDEGRAVDYSAMPHAIFTEPQIGGVGATEEELVADGDDYVVGRAELPDQAMGRAMKLDHGFAKVLAAPDGAILGCHVLGHEASTLIHEAVVAMRHGLAVGDVADTIHAHPTLSKVMEAAFRDASEALDG